MTDHIQNTQLSHVVSSVRSSLRAARLSKRKLELPVSDHLGSSIIVDVLTQASLEPISAASPEERERVRKEVLNGVALRVRAVTKACEDVERAENARWDEFEVLAGELDQHLKSLNDGEVPFRQTLAHTLEVGARALAAFPAGDDVEVPPLLKPEGIRKAVTVSLIEGLPFTGTLPDFSEIRVAAIADKVLAVAKAGVTGQPT